MNIPVIQLEAFPLGSIPPMISHTFYQGDGSTITDLSAGVWTAEATSEALDGVTADEDLGEGTAAIDTDTAVITYAWHAGDFLVTGRFRMVLWTGNGTNRIGSHIFEWTVEDAPGDAPTV